MNSLPLVSDTFAVACCSAGTASSASSADGSGLHHRRTRPHGSRAMSRFCAVPTILKDRGGTRSGCRVESTASHHVASTLMSIVLPFWRATSAMTLRNRYEPSGFSSRAWTSSHRCHGLGSTPSISRAKSMTS